MLISGTHCQAADPPEPGSFVGDYVVGRPIGDRGGTSTVFLSYEPRLDRAVALKRLDADDGVESLLREARLTCALRHPNVLTVHDYFVADGMPYMVMEYMSRGSLRRYVGRLGLAQWMRVLEALLTGLQHAHERAVVHCDIKPENLLLDSTGSVKIADFGIARSVLPAPAAGHRESAGTPLYMAPEQALARPCTPATDLYAAGLVAYELLLGVAPFPTAGRAADLLLTRVRCAPRSPREIDPRLAPEIGEWLAWLLARAPSERPASARAAWERLEELAVRLLGPFWRRQADLERLAIAATAAPCAVPAGRGGSDARTPASTPTLVRQPASPRSERVE